MAPEHRRYGLILPLAVIALYAPTAGAPFQFDDYNVIVDNPAVHSLAAWLHSMPGIRPLLKFSYALNGSLSAQPLGFRLFNIGCHALTSLLVFLLLARLNCGHPSAPWIALSGAALFALHPAQTEAVTYICGRSVALMALLYLGAIAAWLRGWSWPSLLLFLAALLVKETAWTLPFALLLIAWLQEGSWRSALRRTYAHWLLLAVGMALLLAIGDYRRLLGHSLSIRPVGENLLLQIAGQFYLLTQPLLGLRSNIDPDIRIDPALLPIQALALALLYGAGFWLMTHSRGRWVGFALLWFFLHLLPTNSLLPRNDIANDRQLYLALIGPALLLARGAWLLPGRLGAGLVAAAALLLAVATGLRNHDYRSEVALWQATAQHSPARARVWNNLGFAHQQRGDVDAARAAYQRALTLDPDAVRARINLHLLPEAGSSHGTPAGK